MGQFHWDPTTCRELMRQEVPDYGRLQAAGFKPRVEWEHRDLAVLVGDRTV